MIKKTPEQLELESFMRVIQNDMAKLGPKLRALRSKLDDQQNTQRVPEDVWNSISRRVNNLLRYNVIPETPPEPTELF